MNSKKTVKSKYRAFTLVEIIISVVISAFIAMVAVAAMKVVSSSGKRIEEYVDYTSELRVAAQTIRRDLENLYRSEDKSKMLFSCQFEDSPMGPVQKLRFYTISRVQARPGEAEKDVYEVEYFLMTAQQRQELSQQEISQDSQNSETDTETEDVFIMRSFLMRRYEPNPDPNSQPGGILTVMVPDIVEFYISFWDGEQWVDQWDPESKTLPYLAEVNLTMFNAESEFPSTVKFLTSRFLTGDNQMSTETGPYDDDGEKTGYIQSDGLSQSQTGLQ
jgi:Tfp pilus assembly protein PilE